MAELQGAFTVRAGISVIPGPVTLAERALRGEYWCACHGWHRHADGGFLCTEEK
jgi:hypothetical protein